MAAYRIMLIHHSKTNKPWDSYHTKLFKSYNINKTFINSQPTGCIIGCCIFNGHKSNYIDVETQLIDDPWAVGPYVHAICAETYTLSTPIIYKGNTSLFYPSSITIKTLYDNTEFCLFIQAIERKYGSELYKDELLIHNNKKMRKLGVFSVRNPVGKLILLNIKSVENRVKPLFTFKKIHKSKSQYNTDTYNTIYVIMINI